MGALVPPLSAPLPTPAVHCGWTVQTGLDSTAADPTSRARPYKVPGHGGHYGTAEASQQSKLPLLFTALPVPALPAPHEHWLQRTKATPTV